MEATWTPKIEWAQSAKGGYECSSAGNSFYSAFFARLEDGRTIEQHYQCDVKGYDPGGRNWKLGKGKPPLDKSIDLWEAYLSLWRRWAALNPKKMQYLRWRLRALNCMTLTDKFATTPVNQARALATLLNEEAGIE